MLTLYFQAAATVSRSSDKSQLDTSDKIVSGNNIHIYIEYLNCMLFA